ncbi:leucine Rich Repeat domain protein [Candidatus Vecturithrix granuli]|uniref:Leucine Rich Repeat domain protein n=1 Tax=Vecturithrix granuli TaxID=1499967 RepID=A0A081C8L2_VECG1|nr:leucine Rich Repeat domain protein [Candidatus Vecturithrix granuli]
MNDILQYLIEKLAPLGYPKLVTLLMAIAAGFGSAATLVTKLYKLYQDRKLKRSLHPFYTDLEIERATRYYVETKCQNVAPSQDEEPGRTYAFAAREKVIPFFLKKAFKPHQDDCQFYIVLADSGMGKTTFLLNLYRRYHEQFFGAPYQIKLFPLGFPDIDKEIEKIEDKANTILLLDAFDEDHQAVQDYKKRLQELILKVVHFREVVLTCRTQFFPSEDEEPHETGVMRFGGEGGERLFRKFYLSPFDAQDIRVYLRKRFSLLQRAKRRKAQQIVESCPNLMVRPMLLSYIEDLLKHDRPYNAAFEVYAELINRWVEREARKVAPDRPDDYMKQLYQFSREIAVDLYRRWRSERQSSLLISGREIQPFAEKHGIKLSEMEMKSRSLLNRSAREEYKFSHKSVLEYFLAEEAVFNAAFRQELDFDGMDQAKAFFEEMIWKNFTVPFFERSDLNGEYSVKDGKTRVLTRLPAKVLPEITTLKLQEWKAEDEVLLLRGLRNLQQLHLIKPVTSAQEQELQAALPETCEIKMGLLRREPLTISDVDAVKVLGLKPAKWEKFDVWRPLEYIRNDYEDRGNVVFDRATGLLWQKSGSEGFLTYEQAEEYVDTLNREEFAGFYDWRLPTMPELMSLLEPKKQSNGLYINSVFNSNQTWCWSGDKRSSSSAWLVHFTTGDVGWCTMDDMNSVRVVRS